MAAEKSEPAIVPWMQGNARGGKGWRGVILAPVVTSSDTERKSDVPGWQRTIAVMAKADLNLRFTTLAHRLTPAQLTAAYRRLNRRAAPGPDGFTVAEYGKDLEQRLRELWKRLATGR